MRTRKKHEIYWARWALLLTLVLVCVLCSCGTVTPDHVETTVSSYDSSTPDHHTPYNSGVLGYKEGKLWVTANKAEEYNELIKKYRVQYEKRYVIVLSPGDGLVKQSDGTYLLDKMHEKDFMRLRQWQRDNIAGDSLFQKAFNL